MNIEYCLRIAYDIISTKQLVTLFHQHSHAHSSHKMFQSSIGAMSICFLQTHLKYIGIHWVFRNKTTSTSGNHHIPTSISKHFTKKNNNKKHVNIYHNFATPTILHISTQTKAISSIIAGSLPTTTPEWSLCRWTPSSAPPRTPKGIKFSLQQWRSFVPRERHHLEAVHVLGRSFTKVDRGYMSHGQKTLSIVVD